MPHFTSKFYFCVVKMHNAHVKEEEDALHQYALKSPKTCHKSNGYLCNKSILFGNLHVDIFLHC